MDTVRRIIEISYFLTHKTLYLASQDDVADDTYTELDDIIGGEDPAYDLEIYLAALYGPYGCMTGGLPARNVCVKSAV